MEINARVGPPMCTVLVFRLVHTAKGTGSFDASSIDVETCSQGGLLIAELVMALIQLHLVPEKILFVSFVRSTIARSSHVKGDLCEFF